MFTVKQTIQHGDLQANERAVELGERAIKRSTDALHRNYFELTWSYKTFISYRHYFIDLPSIICTRFQGKNKTRESSSGAADSWKALWKRIERHFILQWQCPSNVFKMERISEFNHVQVDIHVIQMLFNFILWFNVTEYNTHVWWNHEPGPFMQHPCWLCMIEWFTNTFDP